MNRALPLLSLLVLAGCAEGYAYVPTTNAIVNARGRIVAQYPIGPAAERVGDARIASYGFTDVSPSSSPNDVFRALHLRVVLTNHGATPWSFDTREQRVELQGGATLPPAFASANPGTPPPEVTVEPDARRVIDLFFLLPAALQRSESMPDFDALWQLHTRDGLVAERTPFERLAIEPGDAVADWDYGSGYFWGGPYWVNELYPYAGFPYGYGYFAGGVIIARAPHAWGPGGGPHGWGGARGGGARGGGPHGGHR